MNKLRARNKICFQNNINIHATLKKHKLKSKKWNFFIKRVWWRKEIKTEKRKQFYQKRLFETQQFKNFYGCIPDYQLKNIFKRFSKKDNKKNIFKQVVLSLEHRLDTCLIRLGLAKTVFQAQQLINHKKITVNKQLISKSGFLLKCGDIVQRA